MKAFLPLAALTALAACATNGDGPGAPPALGGTCNADPGQRFVGQRATPEAGAELLRLTRARELRWGPPRSAMTMDFRADRLTVAYGDDMVITRVSCG